MENLNSVITSLYHSDNDIDFYGLHMENEFIPTVEKFGFEFALSTLGVTIPKHLNKFFSMHSKKIIFKVENDEYDNWYCKHIHNYLYTWEYPNGVYEFLKTIQGSFCEWYKKK